MALIAANAEWEYQEVANDTPADPSAVTVPVADWTAGGIAPFGSGTAPPAGLPDPETAWTLGAGLWIRRNVTLDGAAEMVIRGNIENACYVFFNGEFIGGGNVGNSQITGYPEWVVVVPRDLAVAGTHQVALLCLDEASVGSGTYIHVTADYLPTMVTYQPRAPLQETLAWLTDVQTSKDGTESRTQLRIKARQQLQMRYPVDNEAMRRAFNLIYGQRHVQWAVPVWTQAQQLGAVAEGLYTVTAEPDYSDFRELGYALLWQSATEYQVVAIETLGASSITFFQLTQEFTNAWLMPLRLGFLPSNPTKTFTGHRAEYELTFFIEDNVALDVAAPTQFLDEDIYFEAGLLSGDQLSDDIVGQLDLHDEDLGVVAYYAPWLNTKVARTHRVVTEGPEEAWAFREWLYRRAGRFRGFWQPSFEADLKCLNTSTITTTLDVAADDYLEFAANRTHIAVETSTGWLARTIDSTAVVSATTTRLTLDSALDIEPGDIKRICWLGFKRLNTDNVELTWPGGGICEAEMRLLELNP